MGNDKKDYRKKNREEHVNWFKMVNGEFLADNKGCANILNYIEQVYGGDKDYYAKIARRG